MTAKPSRNQRLQVKYNVSTDFPHLGLHSASASGDIGLVQYAISHGQPVNSVLDGVLPLHAACAGGNDLVVNFLIDCGADVNAPRLPRRYSDRSRDATAPIVGTSGSTPLHFAAANGHLAVVRTLLSRSAIPDRADKHGITPELIARQNGWIECADVLAQASTSAVVGVHVSAATHPSLLSQQRSCTVEYLEASLRKRLHLKRSVDHTLSTTGGTIDPEAKLPLLSSVRPDQEALTQDSHSGDNPASPAARTMPLPSGRPSLPRAPDDSSIKPSFPARSARPRSAGTGADSRKLHSKLSLLSLFKKSNTDGSSSSVASLSESPVPSLSPSRPVPIPSSRAHPFHTPPVSPRSISIPLSSSPHDASHPHQRHKLENSASLINVRAYPPHPTDNHSVLTAEQSRNRFTSATSTFSATDEDSGSADGSSIFGTPIKSGILRMHNRSHSGHGSMSQPGSLPRSIRFERSISDSTTHTGRARSPGSRAQLETRMRSLGIAPSGQHEEDYDRIPDTIEESPIVPHAIPPVLVNITLDHDDDPEEEYGVPLRDLELHPAQDRSSKNSQLPFSINVPPPTEDTVAESRLRGDSVSSVSTTATASTYPQSSSSDAAWSIATPSTPHILGSPRIRLMHGECDVDAEETIHQRPRRLHFPFGIDISAISSHAQAEELVQRTQQSILNMEQYLEQHAEKDSETGRTPLSAKLAAYGESLAIERRLKGKATVRTFEQDADVGHTNGGMSLLSATKPPHTHPSPHSGHSAYSSGETSQEQPSKHSRQTTWTASHDDSSGLGPSPLGESMNKSPHSHTPDVEPDLASNLDGGIPLSRVSTTPTYDGSSTRRGRERDPSRSFQKLSRMGFSTFDNWQPSPVKGRASRSPPPSLRFGLRTIMQSFQGK